MITYRIVSRHTQKRLPSKNLDPKDPDYRENVLQRAINKLTLKPGDSFKVRGTSKRGTIKEIIYDVDKCSWKNNVPYFIVVELDSGERHLANPGSLNTRRK